MAFDLNNLEYLALEGGGGRGILYLEPIRILEERLKPRIESNLIRYRTQIEEFRRKSQELDSDEDGSPNQNEGVELPPINVSGRTPLFQINIPPEFRVMKGISGSSAGAITAFMLSLGMTSEDIRYEMDRMDVKARESRYRGPISVFEQFIDEKPNDYYRAVEDGEVLLNKFDNLADTYRLTTEALYRAAYIVSPLPAKFSRKSRSEIYKWLKKLLGANSKFGVYERIFENAQETDKFIANFLGERGFFSGKGIREYFNYLMNNYLIQRLDKFTTKPQGPAEQITFREFFDLTGVDLVVTGTNITLRQPRMFSLYFTPDFPVIEAVQISMNLPPAFKPTFVDTDVIKGDPQSRKQYFGLYVDGGMLNNYPIRAFDNLIEIVQAPSYLSDVTFRTARLNNALRIAEDPFDAVENCNCYLGIRLEESTAPTKDLTKEDLFPKDKLVIADYLASLYSTFFYPSEEGQIRSREDLQRTVKLAASGGHELDSGAFIALEKSGYFKGWPTDVARKYSIPVEDFATPAIDEQRKRSGHAKMKNTLIKHAGSVFEQFLDS